MRKERNSLRSMVWIIVVAIVFSGCGEINQQPTDEIKIAEDPTAVSEEAWDVLWVSDSSGWGAAEIYGQYVAEDNGIEVNVMDKWKGGLSAGRILKGLTDGDDYESDIAHLRDYVADAEIIVIYGNPQDSEDPAIPGDWNCGQNPAAKCYVKSCGMETFEKYISDLKAIYSAIYTIRKGQPTIVRAFDAYNPRLLNQCASDDAFDECKQCWENYNSAIHQAADEMGVPIAGVFDAWNGPDHDESPVEKGYTREDDVHPNEQGAEVIAQLLRGLGYEAITP